MSSWTLILPTWKAVGASSVWTGNRRGEGCAAALPLSRFKYRKVPILHTWYLLAEGIIVQHLLCAPWELDQISEPVRMTQCYCCNVPPQWCEVSNARNFILHHGKWTPRTSSGQGNPKNMVLRATNKCCSRFIPKLLTQVFPHWEHTWSQLGASILHGNFGSDLAHRKYIHYFKGEANRMSGQSTK